LALLIAVGVYLAVSRSGETDHPVDVRLNLTPEQIDERLGALQKEFQTVLQEKLDRARFEAKARLFTEQVPDEPAGHVLLAQVRMSLNKWEEAYTSWAHALESDPGAYELSKMAGFCAARLSRLEQAVKHYEAAAGSAGSATDCEVYAALGRLYLSLNQPEKAEAEFNLSLTAPAPGEKTNWKHDAYSGLADVAATRGDAEAALSWNDRAIKLAKVDSSADTVGYHIQKARIYMDLGRDDDALTMLTHTWQTYPDSQGRIESARLRAKLYERAGQLDKAVNHIALICDMHFNELERQDLVLADFFALLAEWQIKAGQKDQAKIALANLETLMPQHPKAASLKKQLR